MSGSDVSETTPEWNGLPPTPDVEGWHWVRRWGSAEMWPFLWSDQSGAPGEFCWQTDGDNDPESFAEDFAYIAPCPYPEIANAPA